MHPFLAAPFVEFMDGMQVSTQYVKMLGFWRGSAAFTRLGAKRTRTINPFKSERFDLAELRPFITP